MTLRALPPAFRIDVQPLPTGRYTLEASAGTGKTHAIVGLATRFLADGRCTADELLVVTFSRSASRELRGRLLDGLSAAVGLLERAIDGQPVDGGADPRLVDALVDTEHGDPRERLARLRTALADIDHASIATIHGFCEDLLRRLGDPALGTLLEDEGALAQEIMGDVYVRMARANDWLGDELPYASMKGLPIIRAGMRHPPSALLPVPTMDDISGARVWMAIAAGKEATARKRAGRLHTYDDLLGRLADRLDESPALAAEVGRRFLVGLVDEFQDTDPVQWRILTALFADPTGADGRSLVLVGDPKQAIYAFRGADITTYGKALGGRASATLSENHRSDPLVVEACVTLFQGMPLGPGNVRVDPVAPTKACRLDPAPAAPVAFRLVSPDADIPVSRSGPLIGKTREFVARDVAAHALELLTAGTTVEVSEGGWRDLAPADLAVLVRTNAQARLVQTHLHAVGLPTVLNGVGNVLDTPAARDWLSLLRALQQPWHAGSARLAALSDLIGWTAEKVATAADADTDELHVMLHELAEHLRANGVAAAHRWLDGRVGFSPRLRALPGGARRLADLLHVTEILHAEERASAHGLGSLISWLESAMATTVDPPPDRLARRLEQTGDAVEIMTVHGAKGLQRRVVLAPYLWDGVGTMDDVIVFTDPAAGRRMADVGGNWPRRPDFQAHLSLADEESAQEEMRLAYVAATRAMHHLVLWYAGAGRARQSPMSRLLGRDGICASPAQAIRHATALVDAHPAHFQREVVTEWGATTVYETTATTRELALERFERGIDRGWRRYSYSGLVKAGADAAMAEGAGTDRDDDRVVDDGVPLAPAGAEAGDRGAGPRSAPIVAAEEAADPADLGDVVALSVMPGGAEVGTAVHAVFEHVEFDADDLPDQIGEQLAVQARASSVDLTEVEGIVDALVDVVGTPLGPVAGGHALRDIGRADRIDELEFELPVLPGALADQPGRVLLTDLAALLRRHLPADDPLAPYADQLTDNLGAVEIRGYLAGFIDLIARVPGAAGGPARFLVADYKTNRLSPPGADELRAGHYSRASMAEAMMHHHYPVQALFYLVATHRYLRWRIPDYDPARHLAGVAYLFIRGMTGPDAPVQPDGTPFGVFTWRPPVALLDDLDRLLVEGLDPEDRS